MPPSDKTNKPCSSSQRSHHTQRDSPFGFAARHGPQPAVSTRRERTRSSVGEFEAAWLQASAFEERERTGVDWPWTSAHGSAILQFIRACCLAAQRALHRKPGATSSCRLHCNSVRRAQRLSALGPSRFRSRHASSPRCPSSCRPVQSPAARPSRGGSSSASAASSPSREAARRKLQTTTPRAFRDR